MKFVRFDNSTVTKGQRSFNHFTNEELNGICCFMIDEDMEEEMGVNYCVRKIAEADSTYAEYYNGEFVVFEGSYIEDNFNGVGVIAEVYEVISKGTLVHTEYGYTIKK